VSDGTKVLRPGSHPPLRYAELPERPAPVPFVPELSKAFIDMYDRLSVFETKQKYETDPRFAALADILNDRRKINGY